MKKLTCLLFVVITLLALVLTGCNTEPQFENNLIGSWKYVNYYTDDWEMITFKENLQYELRNYTASSGGVAMRTGDYTYTDTTYSLKLVRTYYTFKYAIEGNRLYIQNGYTYTKQ